MDLNKIVSGLASSGVLGGLAGGAVSGALMGNKKARKQAGTLLKVGGLAALGGVAWKAYQGYRANQPGPMAQQPANRQVPAASPSAVNQQGWQGLTADQFRVEMADTGEQSRAMLLVQSMIAAACSDGHLDTAERKRIADRVQDMGMMPDEKALVFDALQAPLSLNALCERVTCPEVAAEVYLAALIAIDRDRTEARLYLDALAHRLGIPDGLVAQMQGELEQEQHQAA